MTKRTVSIAPLLGLLLALSCFDDAMANPVSVQDGFAAKQPVSDTELSDMRGGFFTAEGAEFDFGANVQTLVNGQLALQTTLNWTPSGISTQQTSGAGTVVASQTVPILMNDTNLRSTTATGAQAPQNLSVTSAAPTLAFANLSNGQIQNIVINRADNQTISQNTNLTFVIYNFAAWQQQLAQNAVSMQVVNEIRAAAGLGGSR